MPIADIYSFDFFKYEINDIIATAISGDLKQIDLLHLSDSYNDSFLITAATVSANSYNKSRTLIPPKPNFFGKKIIEEIFSKEKNSDYFITFFKALKPSLKLYFLPILLTDILSRQNNPFSESEINQLFDELKEQNTTSLKDVDEFKKNITKLTNSISQKTKFEFKDIFSVFFSLFFFKENININKERIKDYFISYLMTDKIKEAFYLDDEPCSKQIEQLFLKYTFSLNGLNSIDEPIQKKPHLLESVPSLLMLYDSDSTLSKEESIGNDLQQESPSL